MGHSPLPIAGFTVALAFFAASAAWAEPAGWAASSFAQPHPAVVRVVAPERDGLSLGSGSLVAVNDASGLVLTNWHVVRDAAGQVGVIFPDGFRSAATVARVDRDWDLAALVIWRPNVPPIPLSSQAPRPGDMLTIAGYGSGPYRAISGRCTEYVAPAEKLPYEMIELDAPARQGDSGGPILNSRGELAGVLFGSAFGRTTGSYCGRVRGFMASVDGDFQRLSAQMMLARQARRDPPPLAAIPSGPEAAIDTTQKSNVGMVKSPATAVAGTENAAIHPATAVAGRSTDVTVVTRNAPSVAAPASLPPPPAGPLTATDQIKTILAAIGAIAVLYSAMRLLGRAVG
jgi:hypothetical protein